MVRWFAIDPGGKGSRTMGGLLRISSPLAGPPEPTHLEDPTVWRVGRCAEVVSCSNRGHASELGTACVEKLGGAERWRSGRRGENEASEGASPNDDKLKSLFDPLLFSFPKPRLEQHGARCRVRPTTYCFRVECHGREGLTGASLSRSDLLWASLLFINAIAVLNEERFLARSKFLRLLY